ncbi:MAG: flagellar hook-length control protein FliK [Micrococcales bacterium]|nr:flagellar hook-length control protein FliK [Micrococcales bacterium]
MSVPAVAVVREPAVAMTARSGRSDGFADVLAAVSADAPSRDAANNSPRNRPAQDRPAQDRPVQDRPVQDRPVQDRPAPERQDAERVDRPVDPAATDSVSEPPTVQPEPPTDSLVGPTAPVEELSAEPSVDPVAQVPVDPAAAVPAATVPVAAEAPGPAGPVPAAAPTLGDAVTSLGGPSAPAGGQAGASVPVAAVVPTAVSVQAPTGAPVADGPTVAQPADQATPLPPATASTAPSAAPTTVPTPAAPDTVAVAPTVPTAAPAPTAPVVATVLPAAPAGVPTPPLVDQLGGHLRALVGARAGTHVLSIALDPKNLGQVRIVAHINADGVRIDLAGANDAARAALRGTLDDLRRDLQSAGLTAELGLADEGRSRDGSAPRRGALSGDQSGDQSGAQTADEPDTPADLVPAADASGHELDLVV